VSVELEVTSGNNGEQRSRLGQIRPNQCGVDSQVQSLANVTNSVRLDTNPAHLVDSSYNAFDPRCANFNESVRSRLSL
jgi:hypothetical protein